MMSVTVNKVNNTITVDYDSNLRPVSVNTTNNSPTVNLNSLSIACTMGTMVKLANIPWGSKSSSVDEGVLGETSMIDDWLFLCVQAGTAGNAKWKKIPLLNT